MSINIMNVSLFHNELISVGLNISGCDSSGNVHLNEPDTNNLAPLVLAAHEQPLTSDECLALQAAITEEQWLAYCDCRKQPIRAQRAERYKNECDPLYLKITEDAIKANTTPDYSEWLTLKDTIRSELPYPE